MTKTIALFLLFPSFLTAQKELTIEDAVGNFQLLPANMRSLQWIPHDERYCYTEMIKGEDYLLAGHSKTNKIDTLLKAKQLHPDLKRIPELNFLDNQTFSFVFKQVLYSYNLLSKVVEKLIEVPENAENLDISPNLNFVAYTIDNNLFVNTKNKQFAISKEINKTIVFGQAVHRNEFGINKGTFWSDKGDKLAFYRMDESMVTDYPLLYLDGFPGSSKMIKYPMAGQKSHHVTVGVYDIASQQVIYLETGEPKEQYLTNIAWDPAGTEIYIALVNRAQNQMKLNAYSTSTGKFIKTIYTEKDNEWVEPMHPITFIPNSKNRFIIQSERDGFNHLYVYDVNGTFHRQLTKGNYEVTDFHGFDKKSQHVYATITDNDGLDRKLIKINIEKGKIQLLTPESGTHSVLVNLHNGFFIDNFTSHNIPRTISVHQSDGKTLRNIFEAKDPLAEYTSPRPELIKLKADDGTTLNARLFKPANMKEGKKYPVIIYVYGGPHAQMVTNKWLWGANNWMVFMASKGYVVLTLDNRGSSGRGKNFIQHIHRHLGDVEIDDQIKGLEYLKKQDFVDASRIGVHGWSYGGFMTVSMLCRYPDAFKAGVAGGPVIDWKMYEVMYTERYMDTPEENPEGYAQSSLLAQIKNLKARLMLIHGTVDPVVVWQHSQELVKQAINDGILIDYMIYPDHEHNVRGKDRIHLMRTVSRYLMEHL
ncbi:MAG: DPP IV N-terminal domain-containing protein [Flavobacteriales bacterium]